MALQLGSCGGWTACFKICGSHLQFSVKAGGIYVRASKRHQYYTSHIHEYFSLTNVNLKYLQFHNNLFCRSYWIITWKMSWNTWSSHYRTLHLSRVTLCSELLALYSMKMDLVLTRCVCHNEYSFPYQWSLFRCAKKVHYFAVIVYHIILMSSRYHSSPTNWWVVMVYWNK